MKYKRLILLLLVAGLFVIPVCEPDKKMLVETGDVSNISTTTADVTGTVIDVGEGATEHGHVYGTSAGPLISGSKTSLGTAVTGNFTSNISGLQPETKYYVRAYASLGGEAAYGSEINFTTASAALPELTTTAITSITKNSAVSGGNITSEGGTPVTARGVCWNVASGPTIALTTLTSDGSGTGEFASSITGLSANTVYYVRAYATNSGGTAYGDEISFTTSPEVAVAPTVTTAEVTSITSNSAVSGGDVTNEGGAPVTSRGVCWSTTANPTITSSKTTNGTGSGSFVSNLTNLNPGTTYYVRAYATNSSGTSYGNEYSFTTTVVVPTLTTITITSITSTTAVSGGDITSTGGASITVRGVCWSTSQNPTVNDYHTSDGVGTGTFVSNLTGLTGNTTYYVRAYATNSAGTAYGGELSFKTGTVVPTLTTVAVTSITSTTATSGGEISSDGGSSVTAKGVCWSTSANPTTTDSKTSDGTGTDPFTSNIAGLNPGTTYHVRAYATNSVGTAYGNDVSFTTSAVIPTVSTSAITDITATTATSGGTVTSDGGAVVTARGVCWSTTANPTTADSKTNDGTGTGSYASNITGLTPGTTYHVRAYAVNSAGTAYGSDLTFTAGAVLATVTTTAVTDITTTTAASGGNVTSDGGSAVTERGICWSTSANPTTADTKTNDGTGTGSFTSGLTGLTPGTTYHVKAYAINSAGTAYGNDQTFTTDCVAPIATTTAASVIGSTTATLNGTINANGFSTTVSFEYGLTTSYGTTIAAIPSPVTGSSNTAVSAGISGLSPNTLYHYTVKAVNCGGAVGGNDMTFLTTTVPGAPAIGTATAGNAQATVTFTPPASDGGSAITVYTATSNPGSITGTGATSPITVTGLTNGTAYTFTVTATNANGTGPASVSSNSVTPSTVPGAPTIGTATAGNAQAIVTFTPPANNGGSIITGYTATSNPGGFTGTSTTSPIIVSGLTNGTAYTFTVTATNANGTGPASAVSNSITPTTVPGAPTIGTATAGNTQATVVFTAPASDGGSAITGYTATSSPGGFTGTGTVSPITVTGLTNGTAYTFTVTATNANGTGPASTASNSVTPSTVPGAPTIGTATKGNTQATITFTPPASDGGSAITGYTVTSNPGDKTGTGTVSPITVTGLTNGTAYTFTVTATNANGTGPASTASNSVIPSTVPGAPTIGTATKGNAQATITFTPPASDGGSAITGYTVTSNPGDKTGTGTVSPITVTGLTNGTAYTFTVKATNANGTGPASTASNSVIPSTVPGAPTIGTATAGNAQATVSFTAPASDGGSAITGYTVTSNPGGFTGTGSASPITVSGLSNTTYTFTVTATNANGTGAASSPSNSVIVTTVPDPPVIGTAAAGNGLATITFWPNNDGGSEIITFQVTSSPGGKTGAGTTSPITVTGLTNGTAYTFTVKATNANGSSAASDPTNSIIPSTVIGIGSSYQGGVVAYIFQSGDPGYVSGQTHGLIAAQQDLSYWGIEWWNGSNVTTGATGTALGTGLSNTNLIITNQGNTGSYAAKNCNDLVLGGYSDWYLPSKDELNKLYLYHTSIGGFKTSSAYWSSTENSSTGAWVQGMGSGSQSSTLKSYGYYVRAIRTF